MGNISGNGLYIGIGSDILSAFKIVPTLTNLYAIEYDANFTLIDQILFNIDKIFTKEIHTEISTKYTFVYNGIQRIVTYFNQNFDNIWPSVIQNIEHIFTMGTAFSTRNKTFLRMLEERTTRPFYIYGSYYNFNVPELFEKIIVDRIKDNLFFEDILKDISNQRESELYIKGMNEIAKVMCSDNSRYNWRILFDVDENDDNIVTVNLSGVNMFGKRRRKLRKRRSRN
jgi:hypothetical protein